MTKEKLLDIAERVVIALLAVKFVMGFTPSLESHPYNWLLLFSEMATVVIIMLRRSGAVAMGIYPIVIGFIGTALPLVVRPVANTIAPISLAIAIMGIGIMISLAAKLFLNRSFGIVAANRGTKRTGPYRLIRHPMYAGYILTQMGFLMLNFSTWNLVIYAVAWTTQVLRIREEEAFLMQDQAYRDYASAVGSRLIPGVF